MMKKRLATFFLAFCVLGVGAYGQNAGLVKTNLSQAEIDRIVKGFTDNEFLFRQALSVYAFDRSATVQTIGMGGQITGTYRRDSYMTFSGAGERFEKIVFFPLSTLTEMQITIADIDNLGGINPFAIEPRVANQYSFTFIGREHIGDFDLYVFDVAPKVMPDPKKGIAKFFSGRIWVDVDDLMIVQSKGKAVPEGKERFPVVETTRGSVDNKYYFPIDSRSDDTLVFDNGAVVRTKFRVRYKNYRVGRSEVRILDEEPTPTPSPKKP